jgi:hypothetical protein
MPGLPTVLIRVKKRMKTSLKRLMSSNDNGKLGAFGEKQPVLMLIGDSALTGQPFEYFFVCTQITVGSLSVLRQFYSLFPKQVLHTVRSGASSFNFQWPFISLRSFSSCLRLLPCLPTTSILLSFLQ